MPNEPTPRPTEKGSAVAGAVAALLAYLLKIDEPGVFAAIAIVLGALPGAITWAVEILRSRRSS